MATVIAPAAALSGELALFQTTDPLLANCPVLVFHGPAATLGASSSRIQVHVITPAGLASYTRLSVSPNSPFYTAVSNLPREEQGDEICRGIAFGLKKYFSELSDSVKTAWCAQAKATSTTALFGDEHVAILATRMSGVDMVEDVVADIADAFGEQRLSWLDLDVVLPAGSIKGLSDHQDSLQIEDLDDGELLRTKYGLYTDFVAQFGDVTFLPTSKLKRAPSKATTIGRSASFLKQQKEGVRKELGELVKTEENYIHRLAELNDLASQLLTIPDSGNDGRLSIVFPPSLTQIQEVNQNLLENLHDIYHATATAAADDIDSMLDGQMGAQNLHQDYTEDTQGVNAVAQCLCHWFPQFAECYREYLHRHADVSKTARAILREESGMATRLQELGEQKLISLLIEPVQRLPRYNLYIDSIVKQLPVRHPATRPLLKARDMITEICAEDEGSCGTAILKKLKARVTGWPEDSTVDGRLVTVVDFIDMPPPYTADRLDADPGILLLFTDGVIMLSRKLHSSMTARTLLTEIESSTSSLKAGGKMPDSIDDLRFIRKLRLDAVQCTESHDGHALQLYTFFHLDAKAIPTHGLTLDSTSVLWLQGMYDGKASRFIEELCKARIEGRFGEPERESSTWELRATESVPDCLGIFSAIFEESNAAFIAARRTNASTRIVVKAQEQSPTPQPTEYEVRTVITLSPNNDGLWCMTVDSLDGIIAREFVETNALLPSIRRKLATLNSVRLAIDQPAMTANLLAKNADILTSIDLSNTPRDEESSDKPKLAPREKFHRPRSPRKLLSSLLSSVGPGSEPPVVLKRDAHTLQAPSNIHRIQSSIPQKPPSRESRPSSKDQATPISISSMRSTENSALSTKRLEDTLSAYVLALMARKGNIVGKNLKARALADELLVNELYNGLLEDPHTMALAAQAPVDVLFASFEKFLHSAWTEQIGNLLPHSLFQEIQLKAETLFPVDFDEYFRKTLMSLTPQNQRALKAIMKLLAELLDGTGNDSDRGTLTAAFAEVLVTEGNPHEYIALIDRFVDDTETYFGEPLEEVVKPKESLHQRTRSANSASLTNNTSSLRKKFGFGTLSRENSKSEQESKVASVWRTLSKNSRFDTSQGRNQVTDIDSSWHSSRPSSQEGLKPTQIGESPSATRAASNHSLGLSTIGEHPSFIPAGPPRKKRRSSLPDLKTLETSQRREAWVAPAVRHPLLTKSQTAGDRRPPASQMPTTPLSKGMARHVNDPANISTRPRLPASFTKENSQSVDPTAAQSRPKSSGGSPNETPVSIRPTSNIPCLTPRLTSPQKRGPTSPERGGLSERPGAGNIIKKPSPQPEKTARPKSLSISHSTSSSPRKLRMQSPQKLRERLQNEKSAIAAVQDSLQDELSKIGDELTATAASGRAGSSRSQKVPARGSISQQTTMDLAQRVLKVEGQLPAQAEEFNQRLDSIQADLSTSLSVSESKCKKLDELYRDANRENEAVYARFNDELARILKAVRGGDGVEELKRKLKESQEETAKLRRENGRLKRENLGLRAQLKE